MAYRGLLLFCVFCLFCLPTPAVWAAAPAEVSVRVTAAGTWLMSGSGSAARTLYVFDKDADAPGGSACDAKCEQVWPPLLVGAGASPDGDWTTVRRASGAEQWAFKGKPLYTFAKDDTPTATYGDGIRRVWHLAFEPEALPPGITIHKSLKGDVLANVRGHSLYYLEGAAIRGKPGCVAACLKRWEPLRAPRIAKTIGDWSAYDRGDGITQWAYKGEPLYLFADDTQPGEVLGDGIDGRWKAALLGPPPGIPSFVTARPSDRGPVLADAHGKTLYAFVGDLQKIERESCDAQCVKQNWVPVLAASDAKPTGNWSLGVLPDGTRQWAYKGGLVYTFVHDARAGDTTGHRFAVGSGGGGNGGVESPWLPILQASLIEPPY
jgi:predicted lipoprotein with Yx(FWY)xxD motif